MPKSRPARLAMQNSTKHITVKQDELSKCDVKLHLSQYSQLKLSTGTLNFTRHNSAVIPGLCAGTCCAVLRGSLLTVCNSVRLPCCIKWLLLLLLLLLIPNNFTFLLLNDAKRINNK